MPQAGQGQCVVAGLGEPVLGLPALPPFDRDTGPQCVVDGAAEEVTGIGLARPGLLNGPAEQEAEVRTGGAELRFGAEREVDLEVPRQEEDAVDGAAEGQVEEHDAAELGAHRRRPVIKDVAHRDAVAYAEGEVDVGEPVGAVPGSRADDGIGDDPPVGTGAVEEGALHPFTILRAEEHRISVRDEEPPGAPPAKRLPALPWWQRWPPSGRRPGTGVRAA